MGGGGSKKNKTEPVKEVKPKTGPKQETPAPPPPEPKYGTYIPFTDFPTPSLLAKGQRDYTAANVEHKLDDKGIPLPFPPPTTRAEVFNLEDYRQIDEHARNTSLEQSGKSLNELVTHLTSPAFNDIGKVRAFFVWIANQGLQKLKAYEARYGYPDEDKPLFDIFVIVYKRLAGRYPRLLSKLCSAANIPCKVVVNDIVKAINYKVGDAEINGHNTHCLVYVDKAWRIIDQHWGSQGVIVKANADWEYLAGRKTNREEEQQIVYHCEDAYFLTDPEAHVYKHWVANTADQLLARPVTRKEFIEMACLKPRYHTLGLTSIDPPRCRVVAETGQVVIKVGLAPGKKYKFDYTLFKSKYLPDYNEVDGVSLDRFVLLERMDDSIQVTVNLRKYGKHKLVLHGAWADEFYLNEFCEYLIDCRKPNAVCQPRPETETRIWGIRFTADKCGLAQVEGTGGVVVAEKGQAVLRFRRLTRKTMVFHHLVWSDEVKKEEMRNNVRYYVTDDEVNVLVNLPKAGQYVYQLNGRDVTTKETLNLGNFLVQADRGVAETYPYPRSDGQDQQLGDLTVTDDKYLLPESHPKPFILWESTEELEIRMKIVKTARFTASLRFCSDTQQETDCSEYLLTEMGKGGLSHFMKFPKVGMYKLTIQTDSQKVYQYLIQAKDVAPDTLPYPKWNASNAIDGFQLLEPRSRFLETDETVKFRVRIAKAVSVTVSGEAGTELKRVDNSDIWEGTAETGDEERDLYVLVQTDETPEPKLLLTYQVKSPAALAALLSEQEKASRRGREAEDRNRRKAEKEAREAEKRAKAMEDQRRKEEEFFEKNKGKFERAEREFEKKEKEEMEKKVKADEANQFSSDKGDDEDATKKEDLQEMAEEEEREAKKRLLEWQITYDEMRMKMARERLRQAAIARLPGELKAAIDECHSYGFNDEEVQAAEHLLRCLPAKIELKEACKAKDIEKLEKTIQLIMDNDLERPLEGELKEARTLLQRLKRMNKVKPFDMDRIAFAEIKTYSSPSPPLHKVMQAALLLVGEDEATTQEWKGCQALVRSVGKRNLLQRIVSVEPRSLDPEICARAKAILATVNELELKRGAAVASFYAWAMGMIEEATEINEWKDDDVTPADVTRQRILFFRDVSHLN